METTPSRCGPSLISSTPWHAGAKSAATESFSARSKANTRLEKWSVLGGFNPSQTMFINTKYNI